MPSKTAHISGRVWKPMKAQKENKKMKHNIVKCIANVLCTDHSDVEAEIAAGHAKCIYERLQKKFSEADTWEEMEKATNAMEGLWKTVESEIMAEYRIGEIETSNRFISMKTISLRYENVTFYVDIVMDTDEELYEAYLYADGYSIKESMFGCPIRGRMFGQEKFETLDSFTNMVVVNLPDHIPSYIEQYMD